MPVRPQRILFISHEASHSGAVFVLLELMKWMSDNAGVEVTILLKSDGPVRNRFEEAGKVYLYELTERNFGNWLFTAFYRRIIASRRIQRHRKALLHRLLESDFDLIYANTMGVGEILDFLKPLKCGVLSHIHELQYVIECTGAKSMQGTVNNTDFYIAVCEDVKVNLVKNYGVEATRIKVIPPFIDFEKIRHLQNETALPEEGEITQGSIVIGGAGSIEWRKGPDIFVAVAIKVLEQIPDAQFLWIGQAREANLLSKLSYDINKAGLQHRIKFSGVRENPYPYYRMFNLFLLTSREDPYPLVCLENMYMGSPVICFEHSGGAVELIKRYRFGKSVPYLDTHAMAEAAVDSFKAGGNNWGAVDKDKLALEHSVQTVAPAIWKFICDVVS